MDLNVTSKIIELSLTDVNEIILYLKKHGSIFVGFMHVKSFIN